MSLPDWKRALDSRRLSVAASDVHTGSGVLITNEVVTMCTSDSSDSDLLTCSGYSVMMMYVCFLRLSACGADQ